MVLTLADLKPRTVDIEIVFKEGHGVTVPLKVPSWVEWNELGMEVPTPEPEMVRVMKDGKPVYEKESGRAYEAKVQVANDKRMMRRVTFALIEAGNFPELRNASVEEQIAAVGSMDAGILQALARTLMSLVTTTMGRISDKVERFRDGLVPENGHGSVFTESVDAEKVGATVAN